MFQMSRAAHNISHALAQWQLWHGLMCKASFQARDADKQTLARCNMHDTSAR